VKERCSGVMVEQAEDRMEAKNTKNTTSLKKEKATYPDKMFKSPFCMSLNLSGYYCHVDLKNDAFS